MKLRRVAAFAALVVAATAMPTAQASEPGDSANTSVLVGNPTVQPKITRLVFAVPQTLDELKGKLAGLSALQFRYTGDIGGAHQPGPGVDVATAVEGMRQSTVDQFGVEPLVFLAVIDGELPTAKLTQLREVLLRSEVFDSTDPNVDLLPAGVIKAASEATTAREETLGRRDLVLAASQADIDLGTPDGSVAPAGIERPWSPQSGKMQAYRASKQEYPRRFRHYMQWYSSSDIRAFGSDFGYEHNLSTYNYELNDSTRPFCWTSAYSEFWAAWESGFKWNAVQYGWNFPSSSHPYWDWDDTTDSCQKLDFSVGVGSPLNLKAGVTYYFWIGAKAGAKSSSTYDLGAQKISNDCNDMGMDPGSSCMGLNYSRPGTGTEPLVGTQRQWRVPGCADWVRAGAPTRKYNGTYDCPANT